MPKLGQGIYTVSRSERSSCCNLSRRPTTATKHVLADREVLVHSSHARAITNSLAAKQAAYMPQNSEYTEKAQVKDSDASPFFKGTSGSFTVKHIDPASERAEEEKGTGVKSEIITVYPAPPVVEVYPGEEKIPIHPLVSKMLAKKQ